MALYYDDLNKLARQLTHINRWWPSVGGRGHGTIGRLPVSVDPDDQPGAWRSEAGVTLSAIASIGGDWRGMWELDFDPQNMPETEQDFWDWVNSHIFIRMDNPETTVPPPDDPASGKLFLPMVLRARWVTKPCPYIVC